MFCENNKFSITICDCWLPIYFIQELFEKNLNQNIDYIVTMCNLKDKHEETLLKLHASKRILNLG